MKRLQTTSEYKRFNNRRSLKSLKKLSVRKRHSESERIQNRKSQITPTIRPQKIKGNIDAHDRYLSSNKPIEVPEDFRLLGNTQQCLKFFKKLRSRGSIKHSSNQKWVAITLSKVEKIDYAAISVFRSIVEDMHKRHIGVKGDFPKNQECKKMILRSGFLHNMYDKFHRPFPVQSKSNIHFFEKGSGKMTIADGKVLSRTMNDIATELMGKPTKCSMLKSLLMEICGNTIEWSEATDKQWMLGVIYNEDKVTVTVADVGKGILQTLFGKFRLLFESLGKTDIDILYGAFEQKYGSKSKDVNRNQGLRLVKWFNDDNCIKGLKVLTNHILLDFANPSKSIDLSSLGVDFDGTFYQWELDKECIENINNNSWN